VQIQRKYYVMQPYSCITILINHHDSNEATFPINNYEYITAIRDKTFKGKVTVLGTE